MRTLAWWRLRRVLAEAEVLVLDVDGVLTDGGLWFGADGDLIKRFDVRDGLGIRWLQHVGVEVAFLSGGRGGATEMRARQLGVRHCLVGANDKPVALAGLCQQLGVRSEHTLFVGDDLNDLAVKNDVGALIATADAALPLRRRAHAVLRCSGGKGAVRELAERMLRARRVWTQLACEGWRERND